VVPLYSSLKVGTLGPNKSLHLYVVDVVVVAVPEFGLRRAFLYESS
jgi:hypothetical protein